MAGPAQAADTRRREKLHAARQRMPGKVAVEEMARLYLEDGTSFEGRLFGASADVSGEVGKCTESNTAFNPRTPTWRT